MIHLSADTGELFEQSYQFAQKQVRKLIEKHPQMFPLHTKDGRWAHEGQVWTHWADGFLPGMMWIFYKHAVQDSAEAKFWLEHAVRYTKPIEPRKNDEDSHDLGFLFLSTYYRWHRLTHETALRDVLIEAGRTLAERFKERGGYLKGFVGDNSLFIDMMMNVGIIFYAARETGDRKLRDIAIRHATTTRRVLVRGDGSTAHEGFSTPIRASFCARPRIRAFAAIPAGRAAWRGRCTGSPLAMTTAAIRYSSRRRRRAPTTT